ncbi:MAG: hypothetical protein DMG41_13425 [Acidobacteria bacterium]|nr:MAG: hypothetical protein AUH13_00480 [Acidobacteria bacterium 13_2_20CM_58_27]PYT74147.1 MAG: hypothetical protein DMG42_11165 [Acidobacteriota bacterium]PYT88017.1 MAG: hypothetical protein DMG41_13425 [Acidobacteriota bacterium]
MRLLFLRIQKLLDEVNMKGNLLKVSILALGLSAFLTVGARHAAAQGPAGAGASEAAKPTSHTPHSLNPIKWVKKDKKSEDSKASRADLEMKLTPKLQAQGLLPAGSNLTGTCSAFTALDECLAALHASHNMGLNFACLSAAMTGVHSNADVSECKAADGEKALPLMKAIHALNPGADAKGATKNAEQQAKDDLS